MAKEETCNHSVDGEASQPGAVNLTILDYYKKFGRKRDLEQYFSLSTADNEVRDLTSLFWRRMKSQDSSDSGEKHSESSTELCRISIKCSVPEKSEDENTKTKSDSESPPIITEYVEAKNTDEDSCNEDNESQKSMDVVLDTSNNKPLSPTSSITSQRKLEWDSLADVGYENESGRKNSASSLSTLERLALKQQYSNNDSKHDTFIGLPTAHSTLIDNDIKTKNKKVDSRKTTRIYKKDVDVVEVNVPHNSEPSTSHSINVNLTKHLSFKMDKDGSITVGDNSSGINVSPEKFPSENEVPYSKTDKEIQTSLVKTAEKSIGSKSPRLINNENKIPVLISLNTLKKRYRRKKSTAARKKIKKKTKIEANKENIPVQEKSYEQVSAAESFEYLPGHIYHQNQINFDKHPVIQPNTDNKSSLESSGGVTTHSSNSSKQSFGKDFEKGFELLKSALHRKSGDSELKKKLIKEVVQRLLKSKYHDDGSTTDFLSGLSFNSKQLGLGENCLTSSTSDSNNTDPNLNISKPRKSILRLDKFNSNVIATTSQSAPNLPTVSKSENPIDFKPVRPVISNTDSDFCTHENHSSDTVFAKSSSEELYQKYLEALKREHNYKIHLKEKETFLKQKLVCSDSVLKPARPMKQVDNDLKNLLYDLTRNNYNDGSGDASQLECRLKSNTDGIKYDPDRKQRSHSVFTLSSSKSDENCKKMNLKKKLKTEIKHSKVGHSIHDHQCLCPHHSTVPKVSDSSVQINERYKNSCSCNDENNTGQSRQNAHVIAKDLTGDIKYVCLCPQKSVQESSDNIIIYKCSQLSPKEVPLGNTVSKTGKLIGIQSEYKTPDNENFVYEPSTSVRQDFGKFSDLNTKPSFEKVITLDKTSKCSQTNIACRILDEESDNRYLNKPPPENKSNKCSSKSFPIKNNKNHVQAREITRYIQTEISIDPKISDPSLTDINIISNEYCPQLVLEECKESESKLMYTEQVVTSLERDTFVNCHKPNQNNKKSCTLNTLNNDASTQDEDVNVKSAELNSNVIAPDIYPGESKFCSKNFTIPIRFASIPDAGVNFKPEINSNVVAPMISPRESKLCSENFTIPIQGTNMTLVVKIGSESETNSVARDSKTNNTKDSKNKITAERTTCLMEECSKGIQSSETDVFSSNLKESTLGKTIDNGPVEQPIIKEDISRNYPNLQSEILSNDKKGFPEKPECKISNENSNNAIIKDISDHTYRQKKSAINDGQQHTYPRFVKHGLKPFLRSNTDTGNFVTVSSAQTEKIEMVDAVTQETVFQKWVGPAPLESDKDELSKLSTPHITSDSSSKVLESDSKDNSSNSRTSQSNKEYGQDPLIDIIKDITKRYSKKDLEKSKKKKCFREIMTLLNYLLDTDDVTEFEEPKVTVSSNNPCTNSSSSRKVDDAYLDVRQRNSRKSNRVQSTAQKEQPRNEIKKDIATLDTRLNMSNQRPKTATNKIENKSVQLPSKKTKNLDKFLESFEMQATTDIPTSSDSATYKVLDKIKKECEKYQRKRCKYHSSKKCEASSSTSVNFDHCEQAHHCLCKGHRSHRSKSCADKPKKKCIAYNLIIQTSDSIVSEETVAKDKPLKNIIVKIPNKRVHLDKLPFKEVSAKIEKKMSADPIEKETKSFRKWPNDTEISSNDDYIKDKCGYSVREYLEINRPDFVEKTSKRQQCLKHISEQRDCKPCAPSNMKMVIVHPPSCVRPMGNRNHYYRGMPMICSQYCNPCIRCVHSEVTRIADQRATKRQLLSVQLDGQPTLSSISESDIRRLAKDLGVELRRKKLGPKFISEREMKKHSEKIYKSLPEVTQKKEDARKESNKRTNLLMANMFKKNLQKKTLGGAVNLSNYSTVIKI